jgi:hypothetical protein
VNKYVYRKDVQVMLLGHHVIELEEQLRSANAKVVVTQKQVLNAQHGFAPPFPFP